MIYSAYHSLCLYKKAASRPGIWFEPPVRGANRVVAIQLTHLCATSLESVVALFVAPIRIKKHALCITIQNVLPLSDGFVPYPNSLCVEKGVANSSGDNGQWRRKRHIPFCGSRVYNALCRCALLPHKTKTRLQPQSYPNNMSSPNSSTHLSAKLTDFKRSGSATVFSRAQMDALLAEYKRREGNGTKLQEENLTFSLGDQIYRLSVLRAKLVGKRDHVMDLVDTEGGVMLKLISGPEPENAYTYSPAREHGILKELKHDNILPFLAYSGGWARPNFFFGCEYLAFPFYRGWLSDIGPDVDYDFDVSRMLKDVTSAVAYLHESGIIHGDIRQGRIQIGYYNRALLAGFEFTTTPKYNEPPRYATEIIGKSRSQPPEFHQDDTAELVPTTSGDVWSLAILFVTVIRKEQRYMSSKSWGPFWAWYMQREGVPDKPEDLAANPDKQLEAIWTALEPAWSPKPEERPNARGLYDQIMACPELED